MSGRWPIDRSGQRPDREEGQPFDVLAERAAAIGVGILIVTGFAASYSTLRDLAAEVGGFSAWLAPLVPLSFDVGVVVLSLKVVLAARCGRPARLLRALVIVLSSATVVANSAASQTLVGRLLHAVPPAMFVICFETLAAGARRAVTVPAQRGTQDGRPSLPRIRWLLAPRQTWTLWRDHVLATPLPDATPPPPVPRQPLMPAVHRDEVPNQGDVSSRRSLGAHPLADTPTASETEAPVSEPPATSRPASAPPSLAVTPVADRTAIAVDAVRRAPDITAVALAGVLRAAGHEVSTRTAQLLVRSCWWAPATTRTSS
ncbi:DUF2637 domain-containing protein [Kineococcus rubinsiae]|uniref:DUF2637 domain-containing protein n=1 Tax=Kineococcus rubinsiae TaxID=2609562 RepID=UPI001FCC775F|nr:DUF2637 domain-containing protein [Kineococcus rubinsiae]